MKKKYLLAVIHLYSSTYSFFYIVTPKGYALGRGHHESSVHRNPYDAHDAYDAIRTQDADLAVRQ